MNEVYVEYDRKYVADSEKYPWAVESSKIRKATVEEYEQAKIVYQNTNVCDHSFVIDEATWLYDFRTCAICGKGLGVV